MYINKKKCFNFKYKKLECTSCYESCSLNCIDQNLKIDNKLCTRCGLCLVNCPADAINIEDKINKAVLNLFNVDIFPLILSCKKCNPSSPFPCLGVLDIKILLSILLDDDDNSKQIVLKTLNCKECNLKVDKHLNQIVDTINDIAKYLNKKEVILNSCNELENKNTSRRSFFKNIFSQGVNITSEHFSEEINSYRTSFKSLFKNYHKYLDNVPVKDLFYTLNIENNCSACGICESLCPSDSIKIENNNEKLNFFHNSISCMNCEVCVVNCSKNAITVKKTQNLGENKIYEREACFCKNCSKEFKPFARQEICLDCFLEQLPKSGFAYEEDDRLPKDILEGIK